MITNLFGNPLLQKALNGSWVQHEAISNNIANADTPGYKRKDVNFQQQLKNAMDNKSVSGTVSHKKHIPIKSNSINDVNFRITHDYNSTKMRMDGNNVDIEAEMSELAKNQIRYNSYSTLMNKHFSKMRAAIRGGK